MAEKRTPHELGDMKPPYVDARELAKQGPAPGTKPGMADELIRRKAIRARSLSEFQVQVDKSKGRRSGKSPSHASNTVATPPVSIAELARALKDDADLIFQHVHNNIEFLPTWGIQKGSEGCLIDGFGNSFDQSKLLVDLLTEAGYTASFVKGVIRISLDQVQNWLGTGGADVWPSSYRLNDGQIPNDPVFVDGDGWTAIDIEHVWVEVEIDSITYVFDPAFKTYTTVAGIDLETATGYVQGDFLTAAEDGATIDMDGNWIEDVNADNIADELSTYSGNLIDYIKTNNPTATLDDVLGGRTIDQIFTPVRETSNPRQKEGDTPDEWGSIPNAYRITVRFQYDGIDETLYGDELHGRRITFFFNGSNEPELQVDGALIATGNAQSTGTGAWLQATVTHPYAQTWFDQVVWMWILAPFSGGGQAYYLIGCTLGTASENMVSHHRRLYEANAFAGSATDEDVLGERLAIRWSMYTGEGSSVADLLGRIGGCVTTSHHVIGLCYLADYPSKDVAAFDVGGIREAYTSLTADSAARLKYVTALGMHGYCLEMLSTQQVTGNLAISTTRVLEEANANGDKIFKGTESNWSSDVTPNLTGYDGGFLSGIYSNYLQWDWFVLIPEEAPITIDGYDCTSFAAISEFGGAVGILNTTFGEQGDDGNKNKQKDKKNEPTQTDPVTVFSGAFLYEQTDMTLGSSNMAFPYQLSFNSRYDSRDRFKTGPLGLGWSHNWMLTALEQSSGFKGLGSHSPIEAAASIVEMLVHFDLLDDTDYPILNMVSGSLCNSWWAGQLTDNAVVVDNSDGTNSEYIRLPDESYNPPFGDVSVLEKNIDGSFTLTDKHQVIREFNTDGDLETIEFPNGVTVTLSYNSGKLETISNGMGRTITPSYTGDKLTGLSDGNGRSVSYGLDVDDQLESITDLVAEDTTFSYSAPGLMESYFLPEHPSDPMITNTFDSLDRVESQLDMNDEQVEFFFAGWRSEFKNALGNSTVRLFNRFGNVMQQIDQLGFATSFELDGLQRLVRRILPEGNSTSFEYDAKNNPMTITRSPKPGSELDDIEVLFSYHATFNKVSSFEDGRGNTTTYSYDTITGDLLSIERPEIDSETPTVTLRYNGRGQVVSRIDEAGMQTQLSYDGTTEELTMVDVNTNWQAVIGGTVTVSDILTITVHDSGLGGGSKAKSYTVVTDDTLSDIAAGLAAAINGDSEITDLGIIARVSGEVLSLSTSPGNSTTFTESLSGGATETITLSAGLNLNTTYGYNDWGDVDSITDARSNETTYDYDDKRRLTQKIDPSPFSYVTNYTYDKNDNLETIERQMGVSWQTWQFAYNLADQMESVTDPLSKETTAEYDQLRQLWRLTDAEDRTIQFHYDARGGLIKVIDPNDVEAQIFSYTNNGLRESFQDGDGHIVHFSYDGFDRADKTIYPDCDYSFEQNALYDANGNVLTRLTRAGQTIEFEYDALNRLIEKSADDMATATFGYDLVGHLLTASTPVSVGNPASGEWRFRFDTAGRQFSEQAPDGKTVSFELDANGNTQKIVYPDTYYVEREYDEMNRLTDIKLNGSSTAAVHLDYDDLSRRIKVTFDNGVESDIGYELTPSSVEHTFNGSDLDFSYDFNNVHQVTGVTVSDSQHMWHPSVDGTIEFDSNRLNQYRFMTGSCGRLFKDYDRNGCLVDDGVFRFEYDAENQLLSADDGMVSSQYVYDPLHRQIQKTVDGTKTRFVYSGLQRLADYNGNSDMLQNRYIFGSRHDEPLITVSNTNVLTYMHTDRLGSIVALTDDTGTVVNRYAYSPFGESDSLNGTTFGFTAQRFDDETGLYYFKRRYYSPALGRFLEPDPMGFRLRTDIGTLDANLYTYVFNDPLDWIDPDGRFGLGLALALALALALGFPQPAGDGSGGADGGGGNTSGDPRWTPQPGDSTDTQSIINQRNDFHNQGQFRGEPVIPYRGKTPKRTNVCK